MTFFTEYTIESRKATVELAKTHAAETRQSLQLLSNHLATLDLRVDNLVTTVELVPRNAKSKSKLSRYAKKSLDHVGEQMTLVFADAKSPRINPDVGAHVVAVLDTLAPQLVRVQTDLKNIDGLAELYRKDLQGRVQQVQSEIANEIRRTEQ